MPKVISAPSKAGPAAVAQTYHSSPSFRPISPLVPMSRYTTGPGSVSRPQAIMPIVMSPPTYECTHGAMKHMVPGATGMSSPAGISSPNRLTGVNGTTPIPTGE